MPPKRLGRGQGAHQLLVVLPWTALFALLLLPRGASMATKPSTWRQPASTFVGGHRIFHAATLPPGATRKRSFVTKSLITMMPEGPEVRTVTDQLQGGIGRRLVDFKILSGRYERNGPPVGWPQFSATMTNTTGENIEDNEAAVDIVEDWNCKGKFIYILLDQGRHVATASNVTDFQRSLWVTLGMTGRFLNEAAHEADNRWARWYLELQDVETKKKSKIYYHDARNFGTIKFCTSRQELATKLQKLGPDVLAESTTELDFCNIITAQKRERNVCKFLMDQTKIAGVGNYILAEGLYRAAIDPFCTLSELSEDQQSLLFRELRDVAVDSYAAQGMTRKQGGMYRNVDGNRGTFEFQLQCYGRERCARGKPVIKDTNGPHGRTIWYIEDQLFMPRSQRAAEIELVAKSASPVARKKTTKAAIPEEPVASNDAAVVELVSGLTEPSWKEALSDAVSSKSFHKLATFLQEEEASGATVYPPREQIFNALNLCPFDEVKVVIVGQDPYHGPGQGHGLAFSVMNEVRAPPSLQNIFREAMEDVGIEEPPNGSLIRWAKQGVLLINTVLTVRRGEANSHAKQGWEDFTDVIIRKLNDNREGLVFLLWGNPAAKKVGSVDLDKHVVIRTSHPSPLGATKTSSPFLGSKCFSRTNDALTVMGQDAIDWNNSD